MFSKYDVYTTVQSMYCYPDTDVLINKLNIHDKAELKQAEEEFTAVKQMALLQEPIKGRFTKTHLFRMNTSSICFWKSGGICGQRNRKCFQRLTVSWPCQRMKNFCLLSAGGSIFSSSWMI